MIVKHTKLVQKQLARVPLDQLFEKASTVHKSQFFTIMARNLTPSCPPIPLSAMSTILSNELDLENLIHLENMYVHKTYVDLC
jgi:hypothetical protein